MRTIQPGNSRMAILLIKVGLDRISVVAALMMINEPSAVIESDGFLLSLN